MFDELSDISKEMQLDNKHGTINNNLNMLAPCC